VIPQNNRVPLLIDEVLLYGINVGVWCDMSSTRIILCVVLHISINYTYSDTGFEHTPITRETVLLFSNTMLEFT